MPQYASARNMVPVVVLFLLLSALLPVGGFVRWGLDSRSARVTAFSRRMSTEDDVPKLAAGKGFGKVVEKKVELVEEDAGTRTYKSQAKRGVPEYNIFLRPCNGSEAEWVPVGSMTIPRDTPVSKALYDVEVEMLKGTFKLYPKLKAFTETRASKDGVGLFEYGYVLKAFPDEQITPIASQESLASEANTKNFFQKWLDSVTNPLDGSEITGLKGQVTLRQ